MKRLVKLLALIIFSAGALTLPVHHAWAQEESSKSAVSSETATPEAVSPQANEAEHDENEQYKHSASVKKIGSMLGMAPDRAATVFEGANFAVLFALLGFAAAKLLPKTFRDRNTAIQKSLVDARTATEAASIRLTGVEGRLAKLDSEIAAIRAQAEQATALDEQRIKAAVEEEKQKILAAAEQEIAVATTQARRQLQQFAAELAIEQAARKLVISAETDRLLVQNFARGLGADDSKEGQN